MIGELLRQAELYLVDGLHPRLIAEGFEKAKDIALDELTKFALSAGQGDREKLIQVARTALRTKIHQQVMQSLSPNFFLQFTYNFTLTIRFQFHIHLGLGAPRFVGEKFTSILREKF